MKKTTRMLLCCLALLCLLPFAGFAAEEEESPGFETISSGAEKKAQSLELSGSLWPGKTFWNAEDGNMLGGFGLTYSFNSRIGSFVSICPYVSLNGLYAVTGGVIIFGLPIAGFALDVITLGLPFVLSGGSFSFTKSAFDLLGSSNIPFSPLFTEGIELRVYPYSSEKLDAFISIGVENNPYYQAMTEENSSVGAFYFMFPAKVQIDGKLPAISRKDGLKASLWARGDIIPQDSKAFAFECGLALGMIIY